MSAITELLARPSVLFGILVVALLLARHFRKTHVDLSHFPVVGARDEWFSGIRAGWRGLVDPVALFHEGYEKYSKHGRAFVVPHLLEGPRVVLPTSQMAAVISLPESDFGVKEIHEDMLSANYTLLQPLLVTHPFHEHILKKSLVRHLGELTEDIMSELSAGFDEYWGMDTEEWTEVNLYKTMADIVARTTSRVFVGLPLCRNREYLDNISKFAVDVIVSGNIIRQLPLFMKPLLGPILTIPNRMHYNRCAKHMKPLIKARLDSMQRADASEKGEAPNDYLQWALEDALADPAHAMDADPDMQSYRLNFLSFVGIHTTTMTITHTLLDLLVSPNATEHLQAIGEEVESVLESNGGVWTKQGLAKMLKTDSSVRESQRLHSIVTSLGRLVKTPGGITLPSGSPDVPAIHLPEGCKTTFPAWEIMRDAETYPDDPLVYEPFRFSNPRESFESSGSTDMKGTLDHKNLSMVSTSFEHLPFGHGKHACPGRFFASNELKLLLAYMTMNYDIQPINKTPAEREKSMMIFLNTAAPDAEQKIKIRRKPAKA